MNGTCNRKFCFGHAPWGPGEGSKGQISLISITKSYSKTFKPNFVFVLTNERYKTYQTGFFILSPGSCPRGRTLGRWGGGGGARGQKNDFNDVAYQIDGDDEQNRMQVKFSSYGETGDLRVRSKGQISLNFG